MTTINSIETRPLKPLFLSYLFPAMIGMLLMSVNILVDGIFVSHGVGPTALAGVNIAVPIFSILLSISLWIGMGVPLCTPFHLEKAIKNEHIRFSHSHLQRCLQ